MRAQRAVRVNFNELRFNVNSVRVLFSSNCTDTVTVDYINPVLITIPADDTGMSSDQCQQYTGLCQYTIQLVEGNSRWIGYPIVGFFEAGVRV